ncbi:2'-5' RNA ligase family protein [uncultured Friedmanniella sp.]|uniref:2'-5' RNA ligase family protein n=1 Tax=uncultured Friedmanniella sp. TaxID=335381 RepID=UPI0035C98A5A
MDEADEVRYGVFLVPDARTSAAVTDVTRYVKAQFGLVSAHRFPPHLTLVGSLPLAVDEADLVATVGVVAADHQPVRLVNRGVRLLAGSALVYEVHHGRDGKPNRPLVDLAADVDAAVRPLLRPTVLLPADVHDRLDWRGHLSLASHELFERADLRDEVAEFIEQLAVPYPEISVATRVAVYRQHHPDWSDGWWTGFRWEHVRSFGLGEGVSARPGRGRPRR